MTGTESCKCIRAFLEVIDLNKTYDFFCFPFCKYFGSKDTEAVKMG